DRSKGGDQALGQRLSGDRKVLDGPLRLAAVISLGRHLDVAHGVLFNAKIIGRGLGWDFFRAKIAHATSLRSKLVTLKQLLTAAFAIIVVRNFMIGFCHLVASVTFP